MSKVQNCYGRAATNRRFTAADTAAVTVNPFARFSRSWLLRQLVEIFDKRHRRAVEALDFRVCGFDDVILVWGVRAAAVSESEMSGRQLKGFAGEDVTGIRTSVARPEQRVDSELFVSC